VSAFFVIALNDVERAQFAAVAQVFPHPGTDRRSQFVPLVARCGIISSVSRFESLIASRELSSHPAVNWQFISHLAVSLTRLADCTLVEQIGTELAVPHRQDR